VGACFKLLSEAKQSKEKKKKKTVYLKLLGLSETF
jgi:hypothetical protein